MRTDSADRLVIPVTRRDHHIGHLRASAQLLEYGDFECPACWAVHPLVKAIHDIIGTKFCFAFRNYPLTSVHPHSETAAEAAEAAGAQDRYWEMHDMLFDNQEALGIDNLGAYAAILGLDSSRLITDVRTRVYEPRVNDDFVSGIRSGVLGTPTFFVNGLRYDGPCDLESMVAALTQSGDGIRKPLILSAD